VIELSGYDMELLGKDGELIFYRGKGKNGTPRVLVLSPAGQRPLPESLKRLENEYSLKEELNPTWATRPIAFADHLGRTVVVLQDPGGVPLEQLLSQRRDVALSLRLAISLSSPIAYLHQRGVFHRDIKPANAG
jgi:serine/threonine protein kinase